MQHAHQHVSCEAVKCSSVFVKLLLLYEIKFDYFKLFPCFQSSVSFVQKCTVFLFSTVLS